MVLKQLNKRSINTKPKSKRLKRLTMLRDSAIRHKSYFIANKFQRQIDESC